MTKSVLALTLLFSLQTYAGVAFEDDRIFAENFDQKLYQSMQTATATQINSKYLEPHPTDSNKKTYPAGRLQGLCPFEKYAEMNTLGNCSAFLIGQDLLVTAGHCHPFDKKGCNEVAWVFGHKNEKAAGNRWEISNDNIFYCEEVIDFKYDNTQDLALIRLNKKVQNATPFNLPLDEPVAENDPVALVGYPLGGPLTFTLAGKVHSISDTHLVNKIDSFKVNSGSALVNLRTGNVEGVLSNGGRALLINQLDGCREVPHSTEPQLSISNRLQAFDYISSRYKFEGNRHAFKIVQNCSDEVEVLLKYRDRNNHFTSQAQILRPGENLTFQSRQKAYFLFARTTGGVKVVTGQDFFGFKDLSRREEFGLKKVVDDILPLCQETQP